MVEVTLFAPGWEPTKVDVPVELRLHIISFGCVRIASSSIQFDEFCEWLVAFGFTPHGSLPTKNFTRGLVDAFVCQEGSEVVYITLEFHLPERAPDYVQGWHELLNCFEREWSFSLIDRETMKKVNSSEFPRMLRENRFWQVVAANAGWEEI